MVMRDIMYRGNLQRVGRATIMPKIWHCKVLGP